MVEPRGLSVAREYEIPWKKKSLNLAELASMRFEAKLSFREISRRMGLPKSTVIGAANRLENRKGKKKCRPLSV